MSSYQFFTVFFTVILISTYFQITETRPHIRHHKGNSRCNKCSPGWGVTKPCSPEHETECKKCERDTYSPHHNLQPCWLCSRCGPGLYEAHPCTSKTDTVCDSCHRPSADNNDYKKKCRGYKNIFLAPEDAKSTKEESSLVNEVVDSISDAEREKILEKDILDELVQKRK